MVYKAYLRDMTGPTSLKISFSFSSVASYGMFPTVNLKKKTKKIEKCIPALNSYAKFRKRIPSTYRRLNAWIYP